MKLEFNILPDDKIQFDGDYYPIANYHRSAFMIKLYNEWLKPMIKLNHINDNNLYTKIALGLKKGDKLEIWSYFRIDPLNITDVHRCFTKSKNKKYINIITLYTYNTDEVFILEDGYKITPNIKTWYDESKLLNEPNFRIVAADYMNELNQEIEKFNDMIIYNKYGEVYHPL